MPTLTLRSRDGGSLVVERGDEPASEWWRARVDVPGLQAAADVDGDPFGVVMPIGDYFRSLASEWRGWDGAREWRSVDDALILSATHDGLGHVALTVRIRPNVYEGGWRAEAVIQLEAGGLDAIAREAVAFAGTPRRSDH